MSEPIPLRLIDPPRWLATPVEDGPLIRHRVFVPGDCWYATREDEAWLTFPDGPTDTQRPLPIAPEHYASGVRPMLVVLPDCGGIFCCQQPASSTAATTCAGWTVTGDLPRVTVHPSVHVVGVWHGWIRDGQLVG